MRWALGQYPKSCSEAAIGVRCVVLMRHCVNGQVCAHVLKVRGTL